VLPGVARPSACGRGLTRTSNGACRHLPGWDSRFARATKPLFGTPAGQNLIASSTWSNNSSRLLPLRAAAYVRCSSIESTL
jgi:hypothetical protein